MSFKKRNRLPRQFYTEADVVFVARSLIGKGLCSFRDGKFTRGIIVETEAYHGLSDKACHAYGERRTPRTEVMYGPGGFSYVYLCYGIHHLFNIVTNITGLASAVLVRAIHPVDGLKEMLRRRSMKEMAVGVTAGPARLTQALGITTQDNACDLIEGDIFLDDGEKITSDHIQTSPRIGIDYAEESALLPWRFYLKNDPFISYP